MRHPRTPRRGVQRGAIAILAAILVPLLFGFGALVIDLARLFVYKTEIQNAMDGCALAASSPLTGVNDPNIFDVGRAHGLATMDITKVNSVVGSRAPETVNRLHFQRDNFALADVIVEYGASINGPWVAATSTSYSGITPATAKYVRCTYTDSNNPLFFLPMLRALGINAATTATVAADAVATLGHAQSSCAFPVAVCVASGSSATSIPPWGLTPGTRLTAVNSPSSPYGTGNFGWVDFTPPSNTTNELYDLVAGSGSCNVTQGQNIGAQGQKTNVDRAWNSRFGVYANSIPVGSLPPDFTGYGYPGTSTSNYADYETRVAARAPYQGTVGNNNKLTTSAQFGALGQKRRVVTAAMVNCSVWEVPPGNAQPPVLDFACILLLSPIRTTGPAWSTPFATVMQIEYLGLASAVGTPCATAGLGGGAYGPLVPVLSK